MNIRMGRRSRAMSVALVLSLMLMLPGGSRQGSAAGKVSSGPVTTQRWLAFPSPVYVDTGTQAEWVDFTGEIHMVIRTVPPDPIIPNDSMRIHTNLAGVMGVGQTSGAVYRVTGEAQSEFMEMLPATLDFQESYRLVPPDPIIPNDPMMLRYMLSIHADGTVGEVFVTGGVD